MTALRSLVAAFVTACDTVEEHTPKAQAWTTEYVAAVVGENTVQVGARFYPEGEQMLEPAEETPEPLGDTTQMAEEPTKRKRRTKAEMLAALQQEASPAADAAKEAEPVSTEAEPALPFGAGSAAPEQPETAGALSDASTQDESGSVPLEPLTSLSATVSYTGGEKEASSTITNAASDEPVTDTELQRFCGRLAQHFGGAQKVFDLSAAFVPEGAVARPTNIKDNSQRWAFIRHAEETSGLRYHG